MWWLLAGSSAHGMHISSTTNDSIAHNTGIINVHAAGSGTIEMHEVYGLTSYTVGTWATALRDFSSYQPFGVLTGKTVAFDNSHFIARPGNVADGFVVGKGYAVADMVSGTYTGKIASVGTEMDLLRATLTGTTVNDQKISLTANVNEKTNPGSSLAMNNLQNIHARMGNISNQLQSLSYHQHKQNSAIKANSVASTANSMASTVNNFLADNNIDSKHGYLVADASVQADPRTDPRTGTKNGAKFGTETVTGNMLVGLNSSQNTQNSTQWQAFFAPHASFTNNTSLILIPLEEGLQQG